MLPRSDKAKRIHKDCPPALVEFIRVTIATGITGKHFYAGETLGDVVKRNCQGIVDEAKAQGFDLRFDMPENTHKALIKGRISYIIRKLPRH